MGSIDTSLPPIIAPEKVQSCGAPFTRTTYLPGGTPIVWKVPLGSTRPRAEALDRPSADSSETLIEDKRSPVGFTAAPTNAIVPLVRTACRSVTGMLAMSAAPTCTGVSAHKDGSVGSGGGVPSLVMTRDEVTNVPPHYPCGNS